MSNQQPLTEQELEELMVHAERRLLGFGLRYMDRLVAELHDLRQRRDYLWRLSMTCPFCNGTSTDHAKHRDHVRHCKDRLKEDE